ncbi:hypothetical protein [Salinactinospora qingdaonensis]|uniref:3'-phosphoadenosine 5'-phosphosulfate sulfotransferase (PAPS reductase)/FAD synthetase n=1 Tax=Salinactinospora qingdaonensis TaxID=702744 RepID=A0ABP7FP25_9ACTN
MPTLRYDRHHARQRLRLLILDGTPGTTALLLLAAHRALPRPDHVLAADTGLYTAAAYHHLSRLERIAADAGIGFRRADATIVAEHTLGNDHPCPLPLFTRDPDGTPGRLPNQCARRQAAVLAAQVRSLTEASPDSPGTVVECFRAVSIEHARRASAGTHGLRVRYPLLDIGWTDADCRAYLHRHDLADTRRLACLACPQHSGARWRELRAYQPEAWEEALAIDAALRHRHPHAAPRPTPPGTTYYLHPARVPLAHADLDTEDTPEVEGCSLWTCRGTEASGQHGVGEL